MATLALSGAAVEAQANGPKPSRKQAPLMLEQRGIFWVGGEQLPRTQPGSESFEQVVGQTYVEYSIPYHKRRKAPSIVLFPGGGLSGVQYQTTPDGREGWADFFVRRGFTTFVVDPPGLGRAGASIDEFNRVQMGIDPPSTQPSFSKWDTAAWSEWNLGPEFGVHGPEDPSCIGNDGRGDPPITCHGNRFPNDGASLKQFLASLMPFRLPTAVTDPRLVDLLEQEQSAAVRALLEKVGPAIFIGHSFGAGIGGAVANARPNLFRAVIGVEPSSGDGRKPLPDACNIATNAPIAGIARVPTLSVHGIGQVGRPNTPACKAKYAEINAAGGNATYVDLIADRGIWGNGHLPMWENNSDQIAQLLLDWIESTVTRRR
jgi:pimeloyl-ACP methyl ester carboxylesterase